MNPIIQLSDDEFSDFSDDDELQSLLQQEEQMKIKNKEIHGDGKLQSRNIERRHDVVSTDSSASSLIHQIDYNEISTYIYPINFELRDYQFNIVKNSFYNNLLVALPTGLGKTFIASTVILNFNRWFPQSKIIFMAPTKPLVAQQIKACCSITGIPASKVAILLDKQKKNREQIWSEKLIFFTTPQVVENDLCSGIIHPKSISLLVIDEAHRAKGNYAYNNVVKFLNRFNSSYRILALTATPASDVDGVQEIINNLSISKVEVRTENSIDIIKYIKRKRLIKRTVTPSIYIENCIELLSEAISPVLKIANERKILDIFDPLKINFFQCMEASRRVTMNQSIPEGLKWSNFFILQLLGVVGQCLRRLNIYGIRSFYSYFMEKHLEFTTKHAAKKAKNKLNTEFYYHPSIQKLLEETKKLLDDNTKFSHPKIEVLMEELDEFFTLNNNPDSKVIIFTEYRESALEIVQSIEKVALESTVSAMSNLKPHIFIGQAKEKEKFDDAKYTQKQKKTKKSNKNQNQEPPSSGRTSSEDAQVKGMSQKLQKQIIKQFKDGAYNILVATSIGEEGLDIGEVDLIVCYDSTSSPIKNIQRMGRTGRKRDGKVVLLLSSNEESKFDKAMGGYEYIQLQIMKGELITLAAQNRILPKDFEPEVVQRHIEIPEENQELKNEDDEDEIIRIATQYMNGSLKRSRKKSKEKTQKKFFLPDNAQTDFRTAGSMLRGSQSTQENQKADTTQESNREKSVLDSILDSDDDESEFQLTGTDILNNSLVENCSISEQGIGASENKEVPQLVKHMEYPTGKPRKTLGLKRPFVKTPDTQTQQSKNARTSTPLKDHLKHEDLLTLQENSLPSVSQTGKKKTLGLKKQRLATGGITDLLKNCQKKVVQTNTIHEAITIEDDDFLDLPSYTPANEEKVSEKVKLSASSPQSIEEDENIFDDGLDEELALMSSISMPAVYDEDNGGKDQFSSQNRHKSGSKNEHIKENQEELCGRKDSSQAMQNIPFDETDSLQHGDFLYKNLLNSTEGLLSANEKMELYTSYYTTLDPSEKVRFHDPNACIEGTHITHGVIGHSKKSQLLINQVEFAKNLTQTKAIELLKTYETQKITLDKCTSVISDDE